MPDNITRYRALLASPSGLDSDREAVAAAAAEVNRALQSSGLMVQVMRWEHDARPTVGSDAQDIINDQLANTADLAIVLVGERLGTPTPRSGSGTVEETQIILERRKRGHNVDLMVFFKVRALRLTKESLEEAQKILEFRNHLSDEGVLWREYDTVDGLEQMVRLFLPESVRALSANSVEERGDGTGVFRQPAIASSNLVSETGDTELGLLDYEVLFSDGAVQLNNSFQNIMIATAAFGEHLQRSPSRITELVGNGPRNPHAIRGAVNTLVPAMEEFAVRLEAETPIITESSKQIVDSSISMIGISGPESARKDEKELAGLGSSVSELRTVLNSSSAEIASTRALFAQLPRMTSDMNMAKRHGLSAMDALMAALGEFDQKLAELEGVINKRMGQ